jgi:hypothetical protein
MTAMLKLSCLCGRVRIELAKRPDFINECNCTLCSKSGARWSYFHPSEVGIVGVTREYIREDKDDPAAEIHFCESIDQTTRSSRSSKVCDNPDYIPPICRFALMMNAAVSCGT